MNPASFNYMQDLMYDTHQIDELLQSNPLNKTAAELYKKQVAEIIQIERTLED